MEMFNQAKDTIDVGKGLKDTYNEFGKKDDDDDPETFQQAMGRAKNIMENPFSTFSGKNLRLGRGGNQMARMVVERDVASISEMPSNSKLMAEFVEISNIRNKKGWAEAQQRLDATKSGYSMDKSLSNNEGVVFVKDGKAVVAFRGTNPTQKIKSGVGKGLPEAVIWLGIIGGKEQNFNQFKDAQKMVEMTKAKYSVERLTGFSMGGTKAITYGNKYSIPTTNFNAFLGKNILNSKPKSKSTIHNLYRTTNDIASAGLVLHKPKFSIVVESIDPIKKLPQFVSDRGTDVKVKSKFREIVSLANQVDSHSLGNFTETGDRVNFAEQVGIRMAEVAQIAGEAQMRMSARTALKEGQSYAEWIHKFNSGVDRPDASNDTERYNENQYKLKDNRVGRQSKEFKMWSEEYSDIKANSKTKFTNMRTPFRIRETEHMDKIERENPNVKNQRIKTLLNAEELRQVRRATTPEEINRVNEGFVEKVGKSIEPIIPDLTLANNLTARFVRNIGNVGRQGAGLLGSTAGAKITEGMLRAGGINIEDLQPEVASLIMGAGAGANTEILLAGLMGVKNMGSGLGNILARGTMVGRGAISGGVGALLQSITTRGLAYAIKDTGLEEGAISTISETTGGAVGGAVSVGIAPYALAGAEIFSEEVAMMMGIEGIMATSIEAGSFGGFAGVAVGAVIGGLVAGGFALSQALARKSDYMLMPYANKHEDNRIGTDAFIVELLTQFNKENNFTPERISELEQTINTRVDVMKEQGIISEGYNFVANLHEVQAGVQEQYTSAFDGGGSSVILHGNYPEPREKTPEELFIETIHRRSEEGTLPLKEYIQNLEPEERDYLHHIADGYDISNFFPEDVAQLLGLEVVENSSYVIPHSVPDGDVENVNILTPENRARFQAEEQSRQDLEQTRQHHEASRYRTDGSENPDFVPNQSDYGGDGKSGQHPDK